MRSVRSVPQRDNPLFPLPADYTTLTAEGQRQARVNAARLWTLPVSAFGAPSERLAACIASSYFFDLHYLHPDFEDNFNPGFYETEPLPWAPFHFKLIESWFANRLNIAVCPRGSGKTRTCRKDIIHRLISCPLYSFTYSTNSIDNARATAQAVKEQCYFNQRVSDDFAPEYGGAVRPTRGERSTGIELFYLENGSWLRSTSIKSRQRGGRPRRYRLDDPEYDQTASTNMAQLRHDFHHMLFNVILPMVMQTDTGCDWPGTFVSRRHFLWHAMLDNADGTARQPEFQFWDRSIVRAETIDDDGNPVSCWPEMWPLDEADRARRNLPRERVTLFGIRQIIGVAAYKSEYLADPGEADGMHWPDLYDTASDDAFFYDLPSPPTPESTIRWKHRGVEHSAILRDFLAQARVFLTVDAAFSEKTTSDYKACVCMAYRPIENLLFVLDLWAGKKKDSVFIREIFAMADRWKAPGIYVEVVRQSKNLFDALVNLVNVRATDTFGISHCPVIRPVRVGLDSKGQRISGSLDFRFENQLIKFPKQLRSPSPPWSLLLEQIEGFNPEAPDLGLTNDDCLDAVALSSYAIKGRQPEPPAPSAPFDAVDLVMQNQEVPEPLRRLGIRARDCVDWSRVPADKLLAILAQSDRTHGDDEPSKV